MSEIRKKILIVEDDPDVQAFLRKRLEASQYTCAMASSVENGLTLLKEEKPDLVILDLGFKKACGTAFLQCAQKWVKPDQKVPPIIVLSGFNDKDVIDYALSQGAACFIPKPYEAHHLLDMVRTHA